MSAEAPGRLEPTATLTEQFKGGLAAPICLTWELTYACNQACVHCLSSSGRRDPRLNTPILNNEMRSFN